MDEKSGNPDRVKPLEALHIADPRSDNQAVLNILQSGAIALDEHHRAMASLNSSPAVPGDVLVQFETAKNLYLYAFNVAKAL
jgi:hypothetical protein